MVRRQHVRADANVFESLARWACKVARVPVANWQSICVIIEFIQEVKALAKVNESLLGVARSMAYALASVNIRCQVNLANLLESTRIRLR